MIHQLLTFHDGRRINTRRENEKKNHSRFLVLIWWHFSCYGFHTKKEKKCTCFSKCQVKVNLNALIKITYLIHFHENNGIDTNQFSCCEPVLQTGSVCLVSI